jgi:hypothetical protein
VGIAFLLGFVRAMQYPSKFPKIYVMEPKDFMGYSKRSNACELSTYGHDLIILVQVIGRVLLVPKIIQWCLHYPWWCLKS